VAFLTATSLMAIVPLSELSTPTLIPAVLAAPAAGPVVAAAAAAGAGVAAAAAGAVVGLAAAGAGGAAGLQAANRPAVEAPSTATADALKNWRRPRRDVDIDEGTSIGWRSCFLFLRASVLTPTLVVGVAVPNQNARGTSYRDSRSSGIGTFARTRGSTLGHLPNWYTPRPTRP
jgi:hypothetical protein